ncbi:uroporphyrinogen-III C-methyltransferase [Arthrobacter castelli]|uniref:uroporphyrinogen-III C-methyltransferase n=1 Tax=Arthrobacter castelli TaxID=271431 RepID=UPI00040596C9|nr:uroporphyrinogen-III C-methyltransferase [Arthrobacter castelli]
MLLTVELRDQTVLVAGAAAAAARSIRRYQAAGATVRTLNAPGGFLPRMLEGVALVTVVDDAGAMVDAGEDGGRWATVRSECRKRGILVTRDEPAAPSGSVTLAGGGPGSDDLLTVRALAALADADVVFHDRLAPWSHLEELAGGAELVNVGKSPGHHPVSQADIEHQMVAAARAGQNVVRLKGGDPFVFGRGGEEVAACTAAGIPVTVVPGVTSAVSVPAAAGIPATCRGVSHMFTVISGHAPLTDDEHQHLAGLGGTIVVLMGVGTLPQLAAGLRKAGMRADTPVAVVESGYSHAQRTTVSDLAGIVTAAGTAGCAPPAVLVIGDVVRQGRDWQQHLPGPPGTPEPRWTHE